MRSCQAITHFFPWIFFVCFVVITDAVAVAVAAAAAAAAVVAVFVIIIGAMYLHFYMYRSSSLACHIFFFARTIKIIQIDTHYIICQYTVYLHIYRYALYTYKKWIKYAIRADIYVISHGWVFMLHLQRARARSYAYEEAAAAAAAAAAALNHTWNWIAWFRIYLVEKIIDVDINRVYSFCQRKFSILRWSNTIFGAITN